jgi:hypothetical protein
VLTLGPGGYNVSGYAALYSQPSHPLFASVAVPAKFPFYMTDLDTASSVTVSLGHKPYSPEVGLAGASPARYSCASLSLLDSAF